MGGVTIARGEGLLGVEPKKEEGRVVKGLWWEYDDMLIQFVDNDEIVRLKSPYFTKMTQSPPEPGSGITVEEVKFTSVGKRTS